MDKVYFSDNTLLPGDIFASRGSSWVSKAVRFLSRHIGEGRTIVSHVGIVVAGGTLDTAVVVQAAWKTKLMVLSELKSPMAVFRPINLTDDEIKTVVAAAIAYEGRQYSIMKLATHAADWLLGGLYVFRRLTQMDRYPICSWIVAKSFAKIGKDFGVEPGQAQPDDIYDFAMEEHEKYDLVYDSLELVV